MSIHFIFKLHLSPFKCYACSCPQYLLFIQSGTAPTTKKMFLRPKRDGLYRLANYHAFAILGLSACSFILSVKEICGGEQLQILSPIWTTIF